MLILCAIALLTAGILAAGTVNGTVTNGTTGKTAGGVDVILIALQGGMQPVANTKADGQGRFRFENPQLGAQPMLIRVPYKGVNYHQPVTPGTGTVEVQVYEPTSDAKAFSIGSRFIVFQPKDGMLLVGEEYNIENKTQPPMTYYTPGGTFQFVLPQGAQIEQVSALGPGGMPVEQGTIDRGKNVEAIDFAFKPGENGVRVSYQMPYAGNQAVVRTTSPYAAERVMAVVPPTMQVLSAGFKPEGMEQGFNVYARDAVAANTPLDISVSGTAPPPTAAGDNSGGSDGQRAAAPNPAEETAAVVPSRMDNVKWILVAALGAIFALGGALVWQRGKAEPATAGGAASMGASTVAKHATDVPARTAGESTAAAGTALMQQAERAAQGSLEEIKDRLFRLELRRQAGTISEEEYTLRRADAEKILHEMLRG
jgi:hypothetical protein